MSPTPQCLVDVADFPVSPTQTGRLPTFHGNFSNHLNTSGWSETPKFSRDFPTTWSMSATSCDKSPTSPKISRDKCRGDVSGKSADWNLDFCTQWVQSSSARSRIQSACQTGVFYVISPFTHPFSRKIIKIVATSCQILKIKCTKFDRLWLRPRTRWGSSQTSGWI